MCVCVCSWILSEIIIRNNIFWVDANVHLQRSFVQPADIFARGGISGPDGALFSVRYRKNRVFFLIVPSCVYSQGSPYCCSQLMLTHAGRVLSNNQLPFSAEIFQGLTALSFLYVILAALCWLVSSALMVSQVVLSWSLSRNRFLGNNQLTLLPVGMFHSLAALTRL